MEFFRRILFSKAVVLAIRSLLVVFCLALAFSILLDRSLDIQQRVLLVLVAALVVWFAASARPNTLLHMLFRRGGDGD